MSDFRVPIIDDKNDQLFLLVELDWYEEYNQWFRSEREMSGGSEWIERKALESEDVKTLGEFFEFDFNDIPFETLLHLSPGDLVSLQRNSKVETTIIARLCPDCYKHWLVYKRNINSQKWFVYGRVCDYSWRFADNPNPEEIIFLSNIGVTL